MSTLVQNFNKHLSPLAHEINGLKIVKGEIDAKLKTPYTAEQASQTLALREMQFENGMDFYRR
jgi:hypothetical protein